MQFSHQWETLSSALFSHTVCLLFLRLQRALLVLAYVYVNVWAGKRWDFTHERHELMRNTYRESDTPFSLQTLWQKWSKCFKTWWKLFKWQSISTALHTALFLTEMSELLPGRKKNQSATILPGIKQTKKMPEFSLMLFCFWNSTRGISFIPQPFKKQSVFLPLLYHQHCFLLKHF